MNEAKFDCKVHYGRIGSGDVWTKDASNIKTLNEKYSTLCEEMESAAEMKVSLLADVHSGKTWFDAK